MKEHKLLILGAGQIGTAICRIMSTDYEITVVDSLLCNNPNLPWATFMVMDVTDQEKLISLMKEHESVVNALPFRMNRQVIDAAIIAKINYFDLSEDVDSLEFCRYCAKFTDKVIMPQCGLAPGAVSVILNKFFSDKQNAPRSIKIRVGALPQNSTNPLGYAFSWSPDGLINEYRKNAKILRYGQPFYVRGLTELEHLTLNGIQYEAFCTSGGIGTLPETYENRCIFLDYKTLRYPGHHHYMNFLLNDLVIDDRVLRKILTDSLPSTKEDKVVIYIEVIKEDGSQETYFKEIYPRFGLTAIQLTTASGVAAMIHLVATGLISKTGFVKNEDVPWKFFISTHGGIYE